HLAGWPEIVDQAVQTLDRVPGPTAAALLDGARGFAGGLVAGRDEVEDAALAAHARLMAHLERLAAEGDPGTALGAHGLTALPGGALAARPRRPPRPREGPAGGGGRGPMRGGRGPGPAPGEPPAETVAALLADHPDADGVLAEAREITAEVIAWTRDRDL